MDKKKLLISALTKYLAGLLLTALLLFLPAGSLKYPNGWAFLVLLFYPMLVMGIVLLRKNPALLEKRLNAKEREFTQKGVVAVSGLMFLTGFITAGLTFRFGWLSFPRWTMLPAGLLFLLSYLMYAEVLRENAYLARTIRVQEGQKVIDTGLYGIVRHPMYAATVLMFLSVPILLGSVISLLLFLPYPFLIAVRIRNEEKVLAEGLEGYTDYQKKVRFRLIPYIW